MRIVRVVMMISTSSALCAQSLPSVAICLRTTALLERKTELRATTTFELDILQERHKRRSALQEDALREAYRDQVTRVYDDPATITKHLADFDLLLSARAAQPEWVEALEREYEAFTTGETRDTAALNRAKSEFAKRMKIQLDAFDEIKARKTREEHLELEALNALPRSPELGSVLNEGGTAYVYEVAGNPGLVIKVLKPSGYGYQHAKRILSGGEILHRALPENSASFPGLVRMPNGKVGVAMQRIPPTAKPIIHIASGTKINRHLVTPGMKANVRQLFTDLEKADVVHSDMGTHNILVEPSGKVWLVDADSVFHLDPQHPSFREVAAAYHKDWSVEDWRRDLKETSAHVLKVLDSY